MKEKFTKIDIQQLYPYSGISIIKNLIVSNDDMKYPTPEKFDSPFIFDGIIFGIVIRGNAKIKINLVEYEVAPNMILTVLPNTIFEINERFHDSLTEFLMFSPEFIKEIKLPPNMDFIELIEENPCLQLTKAECDNLLDYHTFIVKQYRRTDHQYRVELVKVLLIAMLMEIASIYKLPRNFETPKKLTRKAELLSNLCGICFSTIRRKRSVGFYADKMCLTPKYLSKVIKDVTNRSILDWINDAVVSTSKALLKFSDMTVLQISEEINFPNPSFFGRYFKKHTGLTPKEYRERK